MSIESEISWLTLDQGARKAGKYLDQLQQQITDCCSEGVRGREEVKNELAIVKQRAEEKVSELSPLLKELHSLRDELTATLSSIKKTADPPASR